MSVPEPRLARTSGTVKDGRWKWYYASICDYRLAHPGCTNKEVAAFLRRGEPLVSAITNSDLYIEYEAQRKAKWREENDELLRAKLLGVTTKALDILDIQLEKKKDQVPIGMVREIVETGLDRLGFAPATPVASISITNQQVNLPNSVTPLALEEARMALRAVEAQRLRPQIEATEGGGANRSLLTVTEGDSATSSAGGGVPKEMEPAPGTESPALESTEAAHDASEDS